MTELDTRTLAEMPSGISIVSVLQFDHGAQMHTYEARRDGRLLGRADTLAEVADLLDDLA